MIVKKQTLIIGLWLMICMLLYFSFGNNYAISVAVAIISSIVAFYTSFSIDDMHFSYSSVFLLYTIATQFGLIIAYAIFGKSVLNGYSEWTVKFLYSSYLPKALFLGSIAIVMFVLCKSSAKRKGDVFTREKYIEVEEKSDSIVYYVSLSLLGFSLLYFLYNIAIGGTALFSTYEGYMNSSAYNSSIYSYVLIIFYVGTIYLAASGKIKEHKLGWLIWVLIVVFFAMNGNKGEFMYSLLAVIGMKGIEGNKISLKMICIMGLVLFVFIPSITMLREIGLAGNIRSAHVNFVDAFVEMGMQIRTSVYVLEDLSSRTISFLYGASYYKPILNLIPFLKGPTATQHLRELYPGFGFNQVIESYLNFGLAGILMFFGVLGRLITKLENRCRDRIHLAYLGTITCILINATRNYFAFVPGQIVIVTCIFFVVKMLVNKN